MRFYADMNHASFVAGNRMKRDGILTAFIATIRVVGAGDFTESQERLNARQNEST